MAHNNAPNDWPTKAQDMSLALMLMEKAAHANQGQLALIADYHTSPSGEEEIILSEWVILIAYALKMTHPWFEADFVVNKVLQEILQCFVIRGLCEKEAHHFKQIALRLLIEPADILH